MRKLIAALLLIACTAMAWSPATAGSVKRVVVDTVITAAGDTVYLWTMARAEPVDHITFGGVSVGRYISGSGSAEAGAYLSEWAGFRAAKVSDIVSWWLAFQHAENRAFNTSGNGGELLLSVTHPEFKELTLLIGFGVLDGFAINGDSSKVAGLNGRVGLFYEWAPGIAGLGATARGFDEGPSVGYTLDFTAVVFRPDELIAKLIHL